MNTFVTSIYQATINDIDNIIEIEMECRTNREFMHSFNRMFNGLFLGEYKKRWLEKMAAGMKVKIIKAGNEPIGYLSYIINQLHAEVRNIYIVTELRNRGIASKLFSSFLTDIKQQQASKVIVWLPDECHNIIRFYKRIGFQPTQNTRKDYIADQTVLVENEYLLKLDVQPQQ